VAPLRLERCPRRRQACGRHPRGNCGWWRTSIRRRLWAAYGGQHARLRLEGFPWAQYGSVTATVTNVASEIRDAASVWKWRSMPIPALVFLFSTAAGLGEVQIETLSPASLVLRTAGVCWLPQKQPHKSKRGDAAMNLGDRRIFVPEVVQTSAMDCGRRR